MISRAFLLVLLTAAAAAVGVAQAQQYRWVDRNGSTQFGDVPPAGAKNIQKMAATTAKPGAPAVPFELARLQKDFPVTLYTSPSCKEGCDQSRLALNGRGVPFKEVQVFDQDTNDELKRASGESDVPTLLVGRSVQRGFEQGAFDALLDSAGYPKAGILPALKQKTPEVPEGYVSPAGREPAKPVSTADAPPKAGPYDPSGLTGPAPKPGQYDPSGLTGPPPKPGQYGIPGERK